MSVNKNNKFMFFSLTEMTTSTHRNTQEHNCQEANTIDVIESKGRKENAPKKQKCNQQKANARNVQVRRRQKQQQQTQIENGGM